MRAEQEEKKQLKLSAEEESEAKRLDNERHNFFATKIEAAWRGYVVRNPAPAISGESGLVNVNRTRLAWESLDEDRGVSTDGDIESNMTARRQATRTRVQATRTRVQTTHLLYRRATILVCMAAVIFAVVMVVIGTLSLSPSTPSAVVNGSTVDPLRAGKLGSGMPGSGCCSGREPMVQGVTTGFMFVLMVLIPVDIGSKGSVSPVTFTSTISLRRDDLKKVQQWTFVAFLSFAGCSAVCLGRGDTTESAFGLISVCVGISGLCIIPGNSGRLMKQAIAAKHCSGRIFITLLLLISLAMIGCGLYDINQLHRHDTPWIADCLAANPQEVVVIMPTCTCANGTVETGPRCDTDKAERCALCDSGFILSGAKTCSKPPTCATGLLVDPSNLTCARKITCSFDTTGDCGWTQSGHRHWWRGASTPSHGTGAAKAHSGSHFIFLEATSGAEGNASYFISPSLSLISPSLSTSTKSMTFYYHMMHGLTMGTLSVEILVGEQWAPSWSVAGESHAAGSDPWRAAGLNLPAHCTRVRFKGTRGKDYRGDMAIDTVAFAAVAYVHAGTTSRRLRSRARSRARSDVSNPGSNINSNSAGSPPLACETPGDSEDNDEDDDDNFPWKSVIGIILCVVFAAAGEEKRRGR
jgi:hypothetical protein